MKKKYFGLSKLIYVLCLGAIFHACLSIGNIPNHNADTKSTTTLSFFNPLKKNPVLEIKDTGLSQSTNLAGQKSQQVGEYEFSSNKFPLPLILKPTIAYHTSASTSLIYLILHQLII